MLPVPGRAGAPRRGAAAGPAPAPRARRLTGRAPGIGCCRHGRAVEGAHPPPGAHAAGPGHCLVCVRPGELRLPVHTVILIVCAPPPCVLAQPVQLPEASAPRACAGPACRARREAASRSAHSCRGPSAGFCCRLPLPCCCAPWRTCCIQPPASMPPPLPRRAADHRIFRAPAPRAGGGVRARLARLGGSLAGPVVRPRLAEPHDDLGHAPHVHDFMIL